MRHVLIGLLLLISVILVISVLMQPSKAQGITGVIPGAADTFFSKNKAKTYEALMAKVTIVSAIAFAVVTILLNLPKFQ